MRMINVCVLTLKSKLKPAFFKSFYIVQFWIFCCFFRSTYEWTCDCRLSKKKTRIIRNAITFHFLYQNRWPQINPLSVKGGGVIAPPPQKRNFVMIPGLLNELRWNFVPVNFFRNIFRSKPHLSVASTHAQMTHFETWSDFTDQLLCILEQLFSFSS